MKKALIGFLILCGVSVVGQACGFIPNESKTETKQEQQVEQPEQELPEGLENALDTAEEKALDTIDKYEMKINAENLVKENLTCPSTAKFNGGLFSGDNYEYGTNENGQPTIRGYVDAENGFGATVRQYFVVTFDYENETMSLHLE